MLLKNKVVLVSGIGPGLGVTLAVEAAREGASAVILSARTASRLDDAEAQIAALGCGTSVLKCPTDITDRAQCERLAAAAAERFGRIDTLLNSAYLHGGPDFVSSAELDGWQNVFGTNLIGTLKLTQCVLPIMKAQGGGAVVMINTLVAREVPSIGGAGYAASKAALANATQYLAKEVGPDQIRVNGVHFGWIWGAPTRGYFEQQANRRGVPLEVITRKIADGIPLRRIPTDQECARAALFLGSDYASAVTGAALDVNGGAYMS